MQLIEMAKAYCQYYDTVLTKVLTQEVMEAMHIECGRFLDATLPLREFWASGYKFPKAHALKHIVEAWWKLGMSAALTPSVSRCDLTDRLTPPAGPSNIHTGAHMERQHIRNCSAVYRATNRKITDMLGTQGE
jgi:hypothetical protein